MRRAAARSFLRLLTGRWLVLVLTAGVFWGAPGHAGTPEGTALAVEVRNQAPQENFTTTGTLRLRDRNGRWWKELPVRMEARLHGGGWENTYTTYDNERQVVESLVVLHAYGGTNRYDYLPPGADARAVSLTGAEAVVPFAGSHFWLCDFGLEFLFWPEQTILKTEMRKGRVCHVLESVNPKPAPGGYAIIRSWIDREKRGLLRAEAYDDKHRLLKEFNIGSFKKVDGRWQLKSMEIRDELTDERSRLEFDLEIE
ncbi:MAG: outer membrane lipoprotein-sorting protein [Verrucomicrobiales bacterium]|nr:outer membrane lipoprotein-sorting protein [Verrucomicrobiales bacterium]